MRCRHGLRAGGTAAAAEDLDGHGQCRRRAHERQLGHVHHQPRVRPDLRSADKDTPRFFVFGQNQYLKDEFKNIDYLLAPTGGIGFKIIDTAATKFGVDGSVGMVWEKNPGFDVNPSGALATGEKLTHGLTGNTTLSQTFM